MFAKGGREQEREGAGRQRLGFFLAQTHNWQAPSAPICAGRGADLLQGSHWFRAPERHAGTFQLGGWAPGSCGLPHARPRPEHACALLSGGDASAQGFLPWAPERLRGQWEGLGLAVGTSQSRAQGTTRKAV